MASCQKTSITITLKPKKLFAADIYNERYKTPIILKLTDFEKYLIRIHLKLKPEFYPWKILGH